MRKARLRHPSEDDDKVRLSLYTTTGDIMTLTQRQENFTLNLLKNLTQREAWIQAGYSSKYAPAIIDKHACELANKGKIQGRLAELRAEAASAAVMSLQEMLEAHTEIARGRVGHFLDDGHRIKQDSNLSSAAIQELDTSDIKIGKGENAMLAHITKLKLHDPVRSMQEIARLKGHYPKEAQGGDTYNDKAIYFIVADQNLVEGIKDRLKDGNSD